MFLRVEVQKKKKKIAVTVITREIKDRLTSNGKTETFAYGLHLFVQQGENIVFEVEKANKLPLETEPVTRDNNTS